MDDSTTAAWFDVTQESSRYSKDRGSSRVVLLGGAGFLCVLILLVSWKVVTQLRDGTVLSSSQKFEFLFFLAAFGIAVGSVLWNTWQMAPGADQVRLTSEGLSLIGPREKVDYFQWNDPKLAFDLRDWSGVR